MNKKKKQRFRELAHKYKNPPASPECPFFNQCGGCMFQDISYENQLLLKKEFINENMEGIASIDALYPSTPFRYRNRMDMVTAFGKCGLRMAGNYRVVVDIESCPLMQERMEGVFRGLRSGVLQVEGHDYLTHKGYLRYVVLRQAYFTGEFMVNFVVSERENRLHTVIDEIFDSADSISLLYNNGLADLSFGEVIEDVKKGHIEEEFDHVRYRITPNSFFQSNSVVAREIYRRILEEIDGRVLDLYSGVGSISLFIAERADHVTGVEVIAEAVETANINRELNGIENVNFILADAKPFMREHIAEYDTIILDPPRSGMNPKVLKYINRMNAEKIIYMSCNPSLFRQELDVLDTYRLESFEAFDMFPQTPHIETLAVLKKT